MDAKQHQGQLSLPSLRSR